ncbi:MAG: KamA family radical SAM protein [Desulfobacteraceae bacterium]|nr:MAG: KamA family radical SAM protein [Desulfobacteraceae bacterium]
MPKGPYINHNSITSRIQLAEHFSIDENHIDRVIEKYPMKITPHYLSLIKKHGDGLWKQAVPDIRELENSSLKDDPLYEELQSPTPNLIHRYPDRVVFLVSNQCAMYCRYCMRKRRIGRHLPQHESSIEKGIAYIRDHQQIRDVILSGGDPLMLNDNTLDNILKQIKKIQHVEIIRIHSRIPCVLPQRITDDLAETIRKYHPIYLNTHFNHPDEITPESQRACSILADVGIPLGCQTVLLKGVNDSPHIMKELMRKLVQIRVKPYYIHHPDPVQGTHHFRVPIQTGLKILEYLQGNISGLCIPRYMIDLPKGGGKVPLQCNYIDQSNHDRHIVRNYRGELFEYPDA